MENVTIIKTDYAALAAEVQATLTAALESVTSLVESVTAIATADQKRYQFGANGPLASELRGDYELSSGLKRAVLGVRDTLSDPDWDGSGAILDIAKAVARRDELYEHAKLTRIREEEAVARKANIEAANSVERVDSGFSLISTFTKKASSTLARASVLYMLDGTLFDATEEFNPKTRELCRHERNIGIVTLNRVTNERVDLFTAEMTVEEIGKAAHIKDNILAALRAEIGPVKIAA